jgi:hypothetical protein
MFRDTSFLNGELVMEEKKNVLKDFCKKYIEKMTDAMDDFSILFKSRDDLPEKIIITARRSSMAFWQFCMTFPEYIKSGPLIPMNLFTDTKEPNDILYSRIYGYTLPIFIYMHIKYNMLKELLLKKGKSFSEVKGQRKDLASLNLVVYFPWLIPEKTRLKISAKFPKMSLLLLPLSKVLNESPLRVENVFISVINRIASDHPEMKDIVNIFLKTKKLLNVVSDESDDKQYLYRKSNYTPYDSDDDFSSNPQFENIQTHYRSDNSSNFFEEPPNCDYVPPVYPRGDKNVFSGLSYGID